MDTIASQITSLTIVFSTVYSDADQRKHQSFASLAIVRGIRRGPMNSPHKWPVTRKMFPFDDVIMKGKYMVHMKNIIVQDTLPFTTDVCWDQLLRYKWKEFLYIFISTSTIEVNFCLAVTSMGLTTACRTCWPSFTHIKYKHMGCNIILLSTEWLH